MVVLVNYFDDEKEFPAKLIDYVQLNKIARDSVCNTFYLGNYFDAECKNVYAVFAFGVSRYCIKIS